MTERDFKVKKGLTVENGDLEFKAASSVKILDDSSTSLVVKEGSNAYITLNTDNGNEAITLHKATSFNDQNITNVGSIALDTITADNTDIGITIIDDNAGAFGIVSNAGDNYMKIVTTDNQELVEFHQDVQVLGTTPTLSIGDGGAEDTMLRFMGNEKNFRLGIDDSEDTFEIGLDGTHGVANKTSIRINSAGEITKIGIATSPSNGQVLAYNGSSGIWEPTNSASGADGMGSGFVLEDGDGTEVTIDENKEVKFIDTGGLDINWTDTSNGSDGDPYDLTFSLDLNGLTAAAVDIANDSIAIIDANDSNATRKESLADIIAAIDGTGLTASSGVLAVDAAQTQITSVGTLDAGAISSGFGNIDNGSSTFNTGAATVDSLSVSDGNITNVGDIALDSISADGSSINVAMDDNDDAAFTVKQGSDVYFSVSTANSSEAILLGTGISGTAITIGHGTSEVTFGDNVTITGNLTVNGDQTVINTTAIVAEDKSMLLGIAGGMEDATYARSSSTVTVTSASHGFSNGESIFVSNMGNSITDGVYTVSSVATNTFVLDGHGTSGTVGAGATMQHSSANTTEATADGSGIFVPGTSLHSIQYDSSHGFQVSDDLDLANGKHLSINGTTVLNATTLGSGVVSSSLTSVGTLTTLTVDNVLINGSNIGHTGDTDLITVASGIVTVAGELSATTLDIGGTNISSTATELNLVDGSSAGSIVNSKAVIYSSAGQVNGTTLGVNSVSVLGVSSNNSASSSSGAAIDLFTFDKTVFRAAKIVWSVELLTTGDASTAQFEMGETLVQWRSGSDVQLTTYGYMSTTTDLATITAAVSSDNVVVKYDPVGSSSENYKFRAVATQLVL
tara:strand:+ start:278 stop:2830 length:2553 start_codon:yes stop_codon:yes gene_type:complete